MHRVVSCDKSCDKSLNIPRFPPFRLVSDRMTDTTTPKKQPKLGLTGENHDTIEGGLVYPKAFCYSGEIRASRFVFLTSM